MKKIFLFLMLVVLITSCKSKSGRKLATQEGIIEASVDTLTPYENTQIVVYAFKNGDRDPEDSNNFVGYIITANDISSAITPVEYIEDYPWIARGYYELRNLTEDSDHLQ